MTNFYCSICGRLVYPTLHFKDHYVVDYYVEVIGDTERRIIKSSEQDKPDTSYLSLINHKEVMTCIDCIKKSKKEEG